MPAKEPNQNTRKKVSKFKKEKLRVYVWYGDTRKILTMESEHLLPQDASELAKTIEVLVLGYPEAHKLEQPENEVDKL